MRCLQVCSCASIWVAGVLAGAPAVPRLEYVASVVPARAVLGQKVVLTVTCRASRAAAQGVSLEDESLTIELARRGDVGEPRYAFPNRKTIESGNMVIREGKSTAVLTLQIGELRQRSFELNLLFPQELLQPGDFRIGFSLWDGQNYIHSKQAALRLRSLP